MMRMRSKTTELTSIKEISEEKELEVRPGGMMVQKRDPEELKNRIPLPKIRVRVKYGSIYHEMIINSTATFGELKKMLTGPTGLHHEDQKLIYKDKERASKTFLDVVGVKDKSKMVVMEDPISQEKRIIEARKIARIEKAAKLVSEISLEVDRLGGQVSALESVISKGGKVGEKMVLNLIDLLMNQLVRLDEIKIDGDLNLQKKKQVERVQRYVEKLDVLKVKNTMTSKKQNDNHVSKKSPPPASQPRLNQEHGYTNGHNGSPTVNHHQQQSRGLIGKFSPIVEQSSKNTSGAVVVTTQWETFDSLPTVFSGPPSTSTSTTKEKMQPNFNWDLL